MTKQIINIGQTANDKKGDSLRAAFEKVNANFNDLYAALGLDDGGLNLGAFEFQGSTLTTTDSSDITIAQAVSITSNLTMSADIVPSSSSRYELGSASNRWSKLWLGAVPIGVNSQGKLTVNDIPVVTAPELLFTGSFNDLTDKPSIPTVPSNISAFNNDSGYVTQSDIAAGSLTVCALGPAESALIDLITADKKLL